MQYWSKPISWVPVKGVHTFEVTVEMVDATPEEVLAESDRLVKELDQKPT